MNGLHSIKINNDLAALKGAQVKYVGKPGTLGHLELNGEPLYWRFASEEDARAFCERNNATIVP